MDTIFSSTSHALTVGFVVFLGQVVYAAVGFGSGMVTISLLALLYGSVELYVPFFLLLCMPTELVIAWRDRHLVDLKTAAPLMLAVIPALVIGGVLLSNVAGAQLVRALGVIVCLLAVYYLFFEDQWQPSLSGPLPIVIAGALSGILGSLFGLGGPPLIFYFKARGLKKKEFRVALLAIFFAMSLERLFVYGVMGLYTRSILVSALQTIPFALVGLASGAVLHERISEALFKRLTSGLLLISGILLLARH